MKNRQGETGCNQISYIAKSVSYDDDYGSAYLSGEKKMKPSRLPFTISLRWTSTNSNPVKMTFQKRGKKIVSMSCPLDDIKGDITLIMPNIIEFSNSADSVNLFAVHNKSDAVSFTYTTIDGTQKDFKFPLTGFNEKYLEQFI